MELLRKLSKSLGAAEKNEEKSKKKIKEKLMLSAQASQYRYSLICAVNVGTQKQNRGSKNCVNRGYLVCTY